MTTNTTLPEVFDFSNGSTNSYTVESRHKLIPPCLHCHRFIPVKLDGKDYFDFFVRGADKVQNIFHYLTAAQREMLISGTHGPCWDDLFADDDDEDGYHE